MTTAGAAGSDDAALVARYAAARAFLAAEWLGALLMLASFTQLYVAVLGPFAVRPAVSVVVGLVLLAAGAWMFLANRRHYRAMGLDWRRRWDTAAAVVAGSGAIFWLLFALLAFLHLRGVRLL